MVMARGNPSARGGNPYIRDSVETASPGRLLVMLYDRLALDLERAEHACTNGDVQAAHDTLVHAQEIVTELHASLDVSVWTPGQHLANLYEFLGDELCQANIAKDASRVAACRRIIAPLHAAWREAAGVVEPPSVQRIGA
jgi:flagellar secretion chaperone FliS